MKNLFLIVNNIIRGGVKRLCRFYHQRWTYAYLKEKGAIIPPRKEIIFYGRIKIDIKQGAFISIDRGFICNSGFHYAIDNSCGSCIVVRQGAKLTIGEYTGMSNTTIHCYQSIAIGNHVNIGAGTMIFDTNFHSADWRDRANRVTDCCNAKTAPITIGNYVFIGARVIICKGVAIGDKAMVAAGSVVIKNIPEKELWGGNPAKFIRKL